MQLKKNEAYLPITPKQFQEVVNEVLPKVNLLAAGESFFLDADYVGQMVVSALHALPNMRGTYNKTELLNAVINRVSNHVTYFALEEIQKRLKAAGKGKEGAAEAAEPDSKVNLADAATEHVVQ
jgi:hypothetical protein